MSLDAPAEACPYLALPLQWDMLLQSLGKKTRTNVGYYDRALHKVYQVEIGPVTDEAALDEELTRLFELHQRRWNQRWLPGVFGGRRVQAFHRGRRPAAAGAGLAAIVFTEVGRADPGLSLLLRLRGPPVLLSRRVLSRPWPA